MGAAAVPIIMGISTALAAGSAAYQIKNANDMSDKADAAASQQKIQQDQQISAEEQQAKTLQTQQSQEVANANAQAASSAQAPSVNAQKALAAGAGTRNDTILTSPLGIASAPAQGGAKTLLGA